MLSTDLTCLADALESLLAQRRCTAEHVSLAVEHLRAGAEAAAALEGRPVPADARDRALPPGVVDLADVRAARTGGRS